MARFIELMRYALSMTKYEDTYVFQGYYNLRDQERINRCERNFQQKLQSEIIALIRINQSFGNIGLRKHINLFLDKKGLSLCIPEQQKRGFALQIINDTNILTTLDQFVFIQNDIAKGENNLPPCIRYFARELYSPLDVANDTFYPDVLFHEPATRNHQKLCCEIKIVDTSTNDKYKIDISRLHGFVSTIDDRNNHLNRGRGLEYEVGHFIFRGTENNDNLTMLQQIATNTNFDESNKVFVWYFLYEGNGTQRHLGRWVCMPFEVVCERFVIGGDQNLNYSEQYLNDWLTNNQN